MKQSICYFLWAILGCFLITSCNPTYKITHERVVNNQKTIDELVNYMVVNHQDSLTTKKCPREFKKKLKKMKVNRVTRRYAKMYFYPNTIKDTVFEFDNYGGIFHYRQTILIIPSKSKEKYNLKKLGSNYEKVNDTIYIGTWPFLALM
jgi:hypothetical protein